MRCCCSTIFLLSNILLLASFSPPLTNATPAKAVPRLPLPPSQPVRIHGSKAGSSASRESWPASCWTYLRETVAQRVFRLPSKSRHFDLQDQLRGQRHSAPLPPNLLARYGGDVVLRFNITTAEEERALAEASSILFLDVWEYTNQWVDIRLSKDTVPSLLGLLPASLQRAHTLLMHDLAMRVFESYPRSQLDAGSSSPSARKVSQAFSPSIRTSDGASTENLFFQEYQPLSVIIPWMRLLASLFPSHVRNIEIGHSYEGRTIPGLRIGVHPTNPHAPKHARKTIVISGGSHAREWISVSTVNYIAYSLITSYGKSPSITRLLEEFDWVFVPTLNVDGYVYTWESDRLWRKNRQPTSLAFCRGLDLDHGWGYQWDGESSKGNPCSESFPGDVAFEAVESKAFADWAAKETTQNNVQIIAYLDMHSYSQQVLYPYSYSCTSTPPSLENLEELAMGFAKAIRMSTGEEYGVSSACEGSVPFAKKSGKYVHPRIETGGGSAIDWFYHELGVRYAFQMKLRDTGSYGFLLPKENIVPTGEEAFQAAIYLGTWLLGNHGIERKEAPGGEEAPAEARARGASKTAAPSPSPVPEESRASEEAQGNPHTSYLGELRRRRR
ncbi:MAG: putative metallocarboxypeptidase ecm14 [Trizodia sp. TS-e1964]|nr:MAG: putative metallocarboxypeptidase ecm14 [Trizodia sp. TS-e1964]